MEKKRSICIARKFILQRFAFCVISVDCRSSHSRGQYIRIHEHIRTTPPIQLHFNGWNIWWLSATGQYFWVVVALCPLHTRRQTSHRDERCVFDWFGQRWPDHCVWRRFRYNIAIARWTLTAMGRENENKNNELDEAMRIYQYMSVLWVRFNGIDSAQLFTTFHNSFFLSLALHHSERLFAFCARTTFDCLFLFHLVIVWPAAVWFSVPNCMRFAHTKNKMGRKKKYGTSCKAKAIKISDFKRITTH